MNTTSEIILAADDMPLNVGGGWGGELTAVLQATHSFLYGRLDMGRTELCSQKQFYKYKVSYYKCINILIICITVT